jgi:hypothetical protein
VKSLAAGPRASRSAGRLGHRHGELGDKFGRPDWLPQYDDLVVDWVVDRRRHDVSDVTRKQNRAQPRPASMDLAYQIKSIHTRHRKIGDQSVHLLLPIDGGPYAIFRSFDDNTYTWNGLRTTSVTARVVGRKISA